MAAQLQGSARDCFRRSFGIGRRGGKHWPHGVHHRTLDFQEELLFSSPPRHPRFHLRFTGEISLLWQELGPLLDLIHPFFLLERWGDHVGLGDESSLDLPGYELSIWLHCDSQIELNPSSAPRPLLPSASCSCWIIIPFPSYLTYPLPSGYRRLSRGGWNGHKCELQILYIWLYLVVPKHIDLLAALSLLLVEITTVQTH